jgi:hypothetical protein
MGYDSYEVLLESLNWNVLTRCWLSVAIICAEPNALDESKDWSVSYENRNSQRTGYVLGQEGELYVLVHLRRGLYYNRCEMVRINSLTGLSITYLYPLLMKSSLLIYTLFKNNQVSFRFRCSNR